MPPEKDIYNVTIGGQKSKLSFPAGTPNEKVESIVAELVSQGSFINVQRAPRFGPLGVVNPEVRQTFRESVEKQPFLKRQVIESAGPVIGAAIGGGIGALTGPAAPILGPLFFGLGGGLGALASQETGISPKSKADVAVSTLAPVLGIGIGKTGQGLARLGARGFKRLSFAESAITRIELQEASKAVESMGTRILASQTGRMARPVKVLYRAARRGGLKIGPTDLRETQLGVQALKAEISKFGEFAEAKQALGLIDNVEKTLFPQQQILTLRAANIPKEVNFQEVIRSRQLIGAAIHRVEAVSGIKLGSARRVFRGLARDMDVIATKPGLKGKAGQLALDATNRAKLQFAVDDLKTIIAKATTVVRGEGGEVSINAKIVLDRLKALTNPNNIDGFDPNFTSALKDHLPDIIRTFETANLIPVSPGGGAGSLVIRGSFAREMRKIALKGLRFFSGGFAGGASLGGPITGLVAGSAAVYGARMPEMLTAALLHPGGRKFLQGVAQFGRGELSPQKAAFLSQVILGSSTRAGEEGKRFVEKQIQLIKQPIKKVVDVFPNRLFP